MIVRKTAIGQSLLGRVHRQICASTVQSDQSTIQSDQSAVQSDTSQFSAAINTLKQDLQTLDGWRQSDPSDVPSNTPTDQQAQTAISNANGKSASETGMVNEALGQAQGMVNTANGYATKAQNACNASGGG